MRNLVHSTKADSFVIVIAGYNISNQAVSIYNSSSVIQELV